MTKRNAEKITGLEVRIRQTATGKFGYALVDADGYEIAATLGRSADDHEALKRLVDVNYQKVALLICQRQRYRCGDVSIGGSRGCGRLKPLQVHHIQHRSKGRSDDPSGLIALCQLCHSSEHGG
jgi:hypothetical protein